MQSASRVRLSVLLDNLGTALSRRYDASGNVGDLDAAIAAYKQAVVHSPPELQASGPACQSGDALRDRAYRTGPAADLDRAVEVLRGTLERTARKALQLAAAGGRNRWIFTRSAGAAFALAHLRALRAAVSVVEKGRGYCSTTAVATGRRR